jgi:hypothetical protein
MSKPAAPSLPARMLPRWLRKHENLTMSRARNILCILEEVRTHKLSVRRGAELLQMPYRAFLDLMAAHRVPVIDPDASWLDHEQQLCAGESGSAPV